MSSNKQPYLPLYVMDFLTDEKVRECSASSVGVLIMLMCVMHKSDEYGTILLRQKDRQSDDICRCFATKLTKHLPFTEAIIHEALTELIELGILQLEDNKLLQRRMVRDADISKKRAEAGKKGAKTTNKVFAASKMTTKKRQNTENEIEYENESEIETENEIEDKNEVICSAPKSSKYSPPFESFWDVYPRKEGKGDAYKKYQARRKDGFSDEELLDAAKNYASECKKRKTESRYIKHPKTFLSDTMPFTDYLPKIPHPSSETGTQEAMGNPFAKYGGS